MVTDPIADMLTRIRNANQMRYKEVEVPASKMKNEIARILKSEGFIVDYKVKKNKEFKKVYKDMVRLLKFLEGKEIRV